MNPQSLPPANARHALAALAAGSLAGLWMRASIDSIGPSPGGLLATAAILAAGIFLAAFLPARVPTGARGAGLLVLPIFPVVLIDPALRLTGGIGLTAHTCAGLVGAGIVILSAPWLQVIGALCSGRSVLLLLSTPALLSVLLPTPLAAILTSALVLGAWRAAPLPPSAPVLGGLQAVPGVVLGTLTATVGLLTLRGMLDPTPSSALVMMLGAAVTFPLARRLSPRTSVPGLLLGAGGMLLLWGGWGAGWVAALSLSEQAVSAAHGRLLLLLPFLLIGMFSAAAVGGAWGRTPAPLALLGITAGLVLALIGLPPGAPPVVLGIVGLLVIFWSPKPATRLAGLVIAGAGLATALSGRGPSAELASEGLYTRLRTEQARAQDAEIRASMRAAITGWSTRGTVAVRAPESAWEEDIAAPASLRMHVEIDGLISETPSRAAAADGLAGHLGGLLPAALSSALLMGDDLGEAARALLMHRPSRLRISAPLPHATRAIASLDHTRKTTWLSPAALLVPAHPELVLRTGGMQDAIVEIVRAPWLDAAHSQPRPERAAARLNPGGVYIVVLHLSWFDPGTPQRVVSDIAQAFPHVQLWLPPAGADALIVVASEAKVPLTSVLDGTKRPALSDLEMADPLDLASLAIADRSAALTWASASSPHQPLALPAAIFTRPHLHIGELAAEVVAPEAIWAMTDQGEGTAALAERMATRRTLLGLLSEAAAGNMAGVFERAEDIQGSTLSVQTLDPLIDPHLESASKAIAEARSEGPSSAKWDTAARFATTARMLSPESPRPLIAMGHIAAGQLNFDAAEQHFQTALERAPGDLGALTALAQIARTKNEFTAAEQLLMEATAANPQSWKAHHNLGTFVFARGRPDDAEESLRRAAALSNGKEAGPHIGLAQVYLDLDQPVRALAESELACQLEGGGWAWFLRGRAHYELEQYDQAEEDFQRAVLLDPDLVLAHGEFAHIRALRGDLETARDSYRLVLLKDPGNAAARENLRRIELELAAAQGVTP